MDVHKLKRRPDLIKAKLKKQSDNSVITLVPATVMVPRLWEDKALVSIGVHTTFTGVYALIQGDSYAVSTALTVITTDADSVDTVNVDGEEYYAFRYQAGDRVILNTDCLKSDSVPYRFFDAVIDKGKIPWYLEYEDLIQIFNTAGEYAGVNFNIDHSIFEIVMAEITRNPNDRSKFFRHCNEKDISGKPAFIPLKSVQFTASNTTAKLIGAYWQEGLSSALVHPSERKELIEDLLRK